MTNQLDDGGVPRLQWKAERDAATDRGSDWGYMLSVIAIVVFLAVIIITAINSDDSCGQVSQDWKKIQSCEPDPRYEGRGLP